MSFRHNHVQLIGRTADRPAFQVLTDGTAVSRVKLYLNAPEPTDPPQSFRLVAWGSLARRLHEEVRRGQRLLVQGQLRNRSFRTDGVTHLRTEIHLNAFYHLGHPARQPATAE